MQIEPRDVSFEVKNYQDCLKDAQTFSTLIRRASRLCLAGQVLSALDKWDAAKESFRKVLSSTTATWRRVEGCRACAYQSV